MSSINVSHKRLATTSRVVVNTRPSERAQPLTQLLMQSGYTVIDLPLLQLKPCHITLKQHNIMQRWHAGEYQLTVVVSPTAAKIGLAYCQNYFQSCRLQTLQNHRPKHPQNHLQNSFQVQFQYNEQNNEQDSPQDNVQPNLSMLPAVPNFVAVGKATAAVLKNFAVNVVQPSDASQENNEGMLKLPAITNLKAGDKVLIWRGQGGRRLLVDTLRQRGVQVDSIAWYERTLPPQAPKQLKDWLTKFLMANPSNPSISSMQSMASAKWTAKTMPIIVISSGVAFEHWQQILADCKKEQLLKHVQLSHFAYVVLGKRLANMLAQKNLNYVQTTSLVPEAVLKAVLKL